MAGNQNSLVLPVRIVHQIIPERFGADTELFNGLSVRRRLEMKRVFVEILKMLRWNFKVCLATAQSFPGAKAQFLNSGILQNRNLPSRQYQLRGSVWPASTGWK